MLEHVSITEYRAETEICELERSAADQVIDLYTVYDSTRPNSIKAQSFFIPLTYT